MLLRVFLFLFLLLSASGASAKEYFVSLDGDDSWSGTLPEPNADKTDGPFATIEKARNTIWALKVVSGLPTGGVTVWIRGGVYYRSAMFTLSSSDSGTEESPVVWSAYPGETVQFLGGKTVTDFKPVETDSVLARFDESVRGSILQADLKTQGISNYGAITQYDGPEMVVYFKNKLMTLARSPNDGFLTVIEVPLNCEEPFVGDPRTVRPDGTSDGMHCGKIRYTNPLAAPINRITRPERWAPANDIWMFGYWYWDWAPMFQKVDYIDTKTKGIYLSPPYHFYGYRGGQRYYFLNVLEELDSPGEWYIDRTNGILYFLPPEPMSDGDVFVSTMKQIMWAINNTSYVTVKGILFEGSQKAAIVINNSTHIIINGCTIRNMSGSYTISVNGGTENGVINCNIYDIMEGGISLSGGDRKTLTPSNHYAINNHIHHYQVRRSFLGNGIRIDGVGQYVAHNYLHDSPAGAITFGGNDHVMEYNEITKIATEYGDISAIGSGMDWTYRGNVVKYNYIHNIHSPKSPWCMTIYQDMPGSGLFVYGNIFYDLDWGFFTNDGRDNIIVNNIFIQCHPSLGFNIIRDPTLYQAGGGDWRVYEKLMEMNYKEPPYSTRYPALLNLFADGDVAIPRGNVIERNISCGGTFLNFLSPDINLDIISVKNNLIADPEIFKGYLDKRYIGSSTFADKEMVSEYQKYGNIVTNTNPGFVDFANGNFDLKADSPAWSLGFGRIPYEKIGLLDKPLNVKVKEEEKPEPMILDQNSPNPFNPVTSIRFSIPKAGNVKLTVYNMLGQEVMKLADGKFMAGSHFVVFNGGRLASGVYFYRLESGDYVKTRKMLLMK